MALVEHSYWLEATPRAERTIPPRPRSLGGARARASVDRAGGIARSGAQLVAPLSPNAQWRALDHRSLDRMHPARLLELLADVSPELSSALWTFLRLTNPGHTITALRRRDGPAAPKATQDALSAFVQRLAAQHGDLNVLIGRLFIGGFLRGAFCGELVLDNAGRIPIDLATPDPESIRFKDVADPDRGSIWQPGQFQDGQWVALDIPTFGYIPIDPFPGSPYGRSPASPALFPCLFLISLLHDLKRVVQQQGYPRLDLAIDLERLKQSMPEDAKDDWEAFKAWMDEVTAMVGGAYSELEPDDAYIHMDVIKVNRPVGAVDSSSLGAIDGLVTALERMATRALKSMPLVMGLSEGVSEANAARQWEIHAAGIKALQHLCENLLERLLTLAMQAQGLACVVEVRFAELRSAERMRDAQTEALEIANATARYQAGWISQDEAALAGANKAKADVPEPRSKTAAAPPPTDPAAVNPEPGSKQ